MISLYLADQLKSALLQHFCHFYVFLKYLHFKSINAMFMSCGCEQLDQVRTDTLLLIGVFNDKRHFRFVRRRVPPITPDPYYFFLRPFSQDRHDGKRVIIVHVRIVAGIQCFIPQKSQLSAPVTEPIVKGR